MTQNKESTLDPVQTLHICQDGAWQKILLKVSVTEDVQTMQFHTKISQQNYNRITLVPNRIILSSLHANKE